MTDLLTRRLREQTDALVQEAVLPPAAVVVARARRRRRERAIVPAAAVVAAGAVALAVPQLVGRDTVSPPGPAGGTAVADVTETALFGPGLVAVRGGSREHRLGPVDYADYPARPPLVGDHSPTPQQCAVYTEVVAAEHALHSMEHGAAWITHRPDLPAAQVAALARLTAGEPYRLMSPLPGQEAPIVLTAWTRQLSVRTADDPGVQAFLDYYSDGPQTPEKGAACAGTTATGSTPVNQ